MNVQELAINKRTALKMFWDAGHNTEAQLIAASECLEAMQQPTKGYWYANDVSKAIK
jgi:hypothetical protein